jgi:pSer/pThr/pTyr-binding forkhead associated (FHA) protein
MPRLVIKSSLGKNQRFELTQPEVVLGRAEECALVLPNVSVSRVHAKLVLGPQGYTVEDAGSSSGVIVNGKRVTSHALRSGDELQVGKFSMVFLGDSRQERFYKGRYVEYLAAYEPSGVMPDEDQATFALSVDALKKLQQDNHIVESARLVIESDRKRFWYPEERGLTFGAKGMVPVEGWFTGGVCAEIRWDGKQHVLTRNGWFTKVVVNGQKVQNRRPLRPNDQVRIGATTFLYEFAD